MKKKLITRALLILACINLALMIWFAQYLTSGWILYIYSVGSFGLMCIAMVFCE